MNQQDAGTQEGLCHYRHWINLLPELAAQPVTHPTDRLDYSVLPRIVSLNEKALTCSF